MLYNILFNAVLIPYWFETECLLWNIDEHLYKTNQSGLSEHSTNNKLTQLLKMNQSIRDYCVLFEIKVELQQENTYYNNRAEWNSILKNST